MGMFARSNAAGNKQSIQRNDGLPIVQGRKVRTANRRSDYNYNNQYAAHNNNNSSAGCKNNWFWTCIIVAIVSATAYYAYDNSVVVLGTKIEPTTAAAAAAAVPASAPVPAVTATIATLAQLSVPPADLTKATFPAVCTTEQRTMIGKQLPYSNCKRYWNSNCSFRAATASGCQNPILAREFFSNSNDFKLVVGDDTTKFNALLLGWRTDDKPMDLLNIGSGLNSKYNVNTWDKELIKTKRPENVCRTPIVTTTTTTTTSPPPIPRTQVPQVLVIDWEPHPNLLLENLKKHGSLTDSELVIEKLDINNYLNKKNSLDTIIEQKLAKTKNEPIHYVDISRSTEALDYSFLMEMISSTYIRNIRFLHFEYNNKGDWAVASHTLIKLLSALRKNGLVCYWSGGDNTQYSLWRITDCFLDFYNYKHYSRIQCVSVIHDDVKVLSERMEKQFLDTLLKGPTHTFGDQP